MLLRSRQSQRSKEREEYLRDISHDDDVQLNPSRDISDFRYDLSCPDVRI